MFEHNKSYQRYDFRNHPSLSSISQPSALRWWFGSPQRWLTLSTLSKTQQASGETGWCFMLALDIQCAADTSRVQLSRGKDQMSLKLLHPVGTVPNTNSSSSLLYLVTTLALFLIFVHLLLPLNLHQLSYSHRVPLGLRQQGWNYDICAVPCGESSRVEAESRLFTSISYTNSNRLSVLSVAAHHLAVWLLKEASNCKNVKEKYKP